MKYKMAVFGVSCDMLYAAVFLSGTSSLSRDLLYLVETRLLLMANIADFMQVVLLRALNRLTCNHAADQEIKIFLVYF